MKFWRWNSRHWWSDRDLAGQNECLLPLPGPSLLLRSLPDFPRERQQTLLPTRDIFRGQSRLDPRAPQSSLGSSWYSDRTYNSSNLINSTLFSFYFASFQVGEGNRLSSSLPEKQAKRALKSENNCFSHLGAFSLWRLCTDWENSCWGNWRSIASHTNLTCLWLNILFPKSHSYKLPYHLPRI